MNGYIQQQGWISKYYAEQKKTHQKNIIHAVWSHFNETLEKANLIYKWQKTSQGLPGVGEYWPGWAQRNFAGNEIVLCLDCGGMLNC